MSRNLASQFADAAAKPTKRKPKRRRPSSLSIRVSDEERAILEHKAGKRSLGAYVREKVLGDKQAPRRKGAGKPPVESILLGQVLGKLGKSEQVACLFLLLVAAEKNRVVLTETERTALHEACESVQEIRAALMSALGLRGDKP